MTPIGNPVGPEEERYNNIHARTRVRIEQTFGSLKGRFRCLHKSGGFLQYDPVKCGKIAVSCMLLHNYCVQRRIPVHEPLYDEEDVGHDNDDLHDNIGQGMVERQRLIYQVFGRA